MNEIYTKKELFDIYKVYAIANVAKISAEELLQRNNPELLDKSFYMEKYEREKFLRLLDDNVKKNDKLFQSIPKNINSDKQYEYMKQILSKIQKNIFDSMAEYIKP